MERCCGAGTNSSGEAQEAPIVQADGGDGCVLTLQGETHTKGRHLVIPMGGTSRELPGDRN